MAQNQEKESSGNPGTSTPKKVSTRLSTHTLSRPPVIPRSLSKVEKTKHRYGSTNYWKFMFEQSQEVIKEAMRRDTRSTNSKHTR